MVSSEGAATAQSLAGRIGRGRKHGSFLLAPASLPKSNTKGNQQTVEASTKSGTGFKSTALSLCFAEQTFPTRCSRCSRQASPHDVADVAVRLLTLRGRACQAHPKPFSESKLSGILKIYPHCFKGSPKSSCRRPNNALTCSEGTGSSAPQAETASN